MAAVLGVGVAVGGLVGLVFAGEGEGVSESVVGVFDVDGVSDSVVGGLR